MLQNRQRMMGQCSEKDYYYVVSTFSTEGRTVTARAFSLPKHRHKWFGSLTWLGMLQTWYITCYQPYLDHSVPISISGIFSLFPQDQPRWVFFASYLSHLELISFSLDSHFAVKDLTKHWHVQNVSPQNFSCLTCINYTAYFFQIKAHTHESTAQLTLEETTTLPPTPDSDLLHASKAEKRANSLAEAEQLGRPRGALLVSRCIWDNVSCSSFLCKHAVFTPGPSSSLPM